MQGDSSSLIKTLLNQHAMFKLLQLSVSEWHHLPPLDGMERLTAVALVTLPSRSTPSPPLLPIQRCDIHLQQLVSFLSAGPLFFPWSEVQQDDLKFDLNLRNLSLSNESEMAY